MAALQTGRHTSRRPARWWILAAAIPPAVAVATEVLAPDPDGHWAEHLSGAALKATQLLVLLVLVVLVARRRRLPVVLLAAFAVVAIGVALQAFGDAQVADSIWGTSGDPGFGGGYEAGHDLSAVGDLLVLVGGLAFAAAAGATRVVRPAHAVVAGVLAIIPPPFLFPAVGVMFVLLHELTTTLDSGEEPPPGRSGPINR
jgi:hypothetical protein